DADRNDQTAYYGKTVADRHIGSNFLDGFALHHHNYMNVGYMVICLSNVAMIHLLLKSLGIPVPGYVHHNAKHLWQLVRQCIFPDGRLVRIGGDTRVRYCYCQDYLVPVLLMMCDMEKDGRAKHLLLEWIKQVRTEFDANKDGSFLSQRASDLPGISPLYYHRLESDRAVSLSLAVHYAKVVDGLEIVRGTYTDRFTWHGSFHGSTYVRGKRSLASFTWLAGEPPQGLCLPLDGSNLAEWKQNLCGDIIGMGQRNTREKLTHATGLFEKGFMTFGSSVAVTGNLMEGSPEQEEVARIHNFFLALPDDATVVVYQFATTIHRKYVRHVKGILLKIPNDIFNGGKRTYRFHDTVCIAEKRKDTDEVIDTASRMVNVDNRLTLVSLDTGQNIRIYRPAKRQTGILHSHFPNGFLHCDELCTQLELKVRDHSHGQVILDTGALALTGLSHKESREYMGSFAPALERPSPYVRRISVFDITGKPYLIWLNTGEKSTFGVPAQSALLLGDMEKKAGRTDHILVTINEAGRPGAD
ncbi:MAG: hypothetical protein R6W96_02750, partial [Clostridia bacterium]